MLYGNFINKLTSGNGRWNSPLGIIYNQTQTTSNKYIHGMSIGASSASNHRVNLLRAIHYYNNVKRIGQTAYQNDKCVGTNILCSDLDGTLIKGDITEGSSYFSGIVEHLYSIGQVVSTKYPTYVEYKDEYFKRVDKYDTGAYAMPYEIYNPSQDPYISQYWETTISKFFVKYTKKYLKDKNKRSYKIWIVSASPRVYIEPIKKYLNVDRILAVEPEETTEAITYAAGKLKRLQENTDNKLTGIAGYIGDSWNNDGVVMQYLKNVNINSDVQFIHHGQTTPNDYKNLKKYGILKIDAY